MADIRKIIPYIKKWEGGFSDHAADRGKATMCGITLNTFILYRKAKGLPEPTVTDLKNISEEEWMAILKWGYWDYWKADNIVSQSLANILVCWAWGSGAITSIKQFQKIMGLVQDGIVGPITLGTINNANQVALFNKIWLARKDFFVDIVERDRSQMVFLKGWLNRLYDLLLYCFDLQVNG